LSDVKIVDFLAYRNKNWQQNKPVNKEMVKEVFFMSSVYDFICCPPSTCHDLLNVCPVRCRKQCRLLSLDQTLWLRSADARCEDACIHGA